MNVSAQIYGVVTDEETGEPLPYLNVYYDGKGVGTVTNLDGEYKITQKSGWTKLSFSMVGYTTQVINVSDRTRKLNVKMRPVMLTEVVVKKKRKETNIHARIIRL